MKSITLFNTKLILLAGIVSLLLSFGFVQSVYAFTPTEDFFDNQADQGSAYQERIAALQEQIAKLLEQLNGSDTDDSDGPNPSWGSGSGSSWSGFKRSLYRGVRDGVDDGDIERLQRCLAKTGDYTYGEFTGYFGSATEEAVKSFQRRNDIVSSGDGWSTGYGWFGPKTQKRLNEYCAPEVEDDEDGDANSELKVTVRGYSVQLTVVLNNGCAGYKVDWGDDEEEEDIKEAAGENPTCTQVFSWKKLTHEYDEAGEYTIDVTLFAGSEEREVKSKTIEIVEKEKPVCGFDRPCITDEDDDLDEAGVCISDGKEYAEGAKLNGLRGAGSGSVVSDGYYICEDGEWVMKGSDWSNNNPPFSYSQGSYEEPISSGGAISDDGNWTQNEMDEAGAVPMGVEIDECEKSYWWSYYRCKQDSGDDGDYSSWRDEYNNKQNTSSGRSVGSGWGGYVQGASTTNVIEQLKEIVVGLENLSLLMSSR